MSAPTSCFRRLARLMLDGRMLDGRAWPQGDEAAR